MNIREGFMLRELGEQYVVVPLGNTSKEFHGIIRLNKTGAFLWELLEEEHSTEELLNFMLLNYDIDASTAIHDIEAFLDKIRNAELLTQEISKYS